MSFRFWIITVLGVFSAVLTYGQQEAQVTQNMFNYMSVNPGYAGMRDGICVNGIVRQQYVGLQNMEGDNVNPETFFLSVDTPLEFLHGGLGLTIHQDEIGYTSNVGIELDYSYHTKLRYGDLGIGFNIGFLNETIDFGKFNPIDGSDPLLENREGEEQGMIINFSLGAYYKVEGDYYAGISTTRILQAQEPNTRYYPRRHYYFMGGYHYQLTTEYELIPSVMMKFDGQTTQFDLGSVVQYKDKYWGGINYRVQDAVSLIAGLQWKDFKFGYSYDLNTSRLAGAGSGGAHELMLGYCFKLEMEKDNNKYRNTRFL
ncbi:MAG: type IX secretion system membrane protein PorP/SprF [Bacteroidales bacterium]|nr:type IX secretion system membrane protein PorP/SprF [Bacteroidales bacterium]MCF8332728.1 type IX secretion system membrane protein PorP/SprF [Bacteroidales bacterium]